MNPHPNPKLALPLAIILVVIIALGAYWLGTTTDKVAAPTSTPTPISTVNPTATPIASPSPSLSSTGVMPVAVTTCLPANLSATLSNAQGTAGTIYYNIELTNNSSVSCTLAGPPTVSFLNASGISLGNTTNTASSSTQTITLAAGAKAYSAIGFPESGNFPNGTCKTTSSLQVTPPGTNNALTIGNLSSYSPGATDAYCQKFSVTDFSLSAQ